GICSNGSSPDGRWQRPRLPGSFGGGCGTTRSCSWGINSPSTGLPAWWCSRSRRCSRRLSTAGSCLRRGGSWSACRETCRAAMPGSDERPSEDKSPGFGRVLLLLEVIFRAGVALLTSPFHGLVLWYRDRRFVRRMREQGRFIPWPQLEPRLVKGEG